MTSIPTRFSAFPLRAVVYLLAASPLMHTAQAQRSSLFIAQYAAPPAKAVPSASLAETARASVAFPTIVSNDVDTTSTSEFPGIFPNAPSFVLEGQVGNIPLSSEPRHGEIAPKYSGIILPGLVAQHLSAREKVHFAFKSAVSPFNLLSWTVSSAYSQGVNSSPHFGQGWGPYAQRYGASAARGTIQTLAADAIFAPLLHDDPRYYERGRGHNVADRGLYAASRVVLTRNDTGQTRLNIPLLAGRAISSAAANGFIPERDRGGSETAQRFATSLGGAAIGLLVNEFLDDGLRAAHLRK